MGQQVEHLALAQRQSLDELERLGKQDMSAAGALDGRLGVERQPVDVIFGQGFALDQQLGVSLIHIQAADVEREAVRYFGSQLDEPADLCTVHISFVAEDRLVWQVSQAQLGFGVLSPEHREEAVRSGGRDLEVSLK